MDVIPVALFAYARPVHTARVLACLKENKVPLVLAFADGAKGASDAAAVEETRTLLRAIDWCDVRLIERERNLGLGSNIMSGVKEVAKEHDAFIVWEDDLICVPGTYAWLTAALRHYTNEQRVMSVAAWTHPKVTPANVLNSPYFDARAECWVWGAWSRSWSTMNSETAVEKRAMAASRGVVADAYGADLPAMAREEARKNIWAVRWLYHHLARGGLCLRPPWSMVEHIGFDLSATNASGEVAWMTPLHHESPPIPSCWPEPIEHSECRGLWQKASARPSFPVRLFTWFSKMRQKKAK